MTERVQKNLCILASIFTIVFVVIGSSYHQIKQAYDERWDAVLQRRYKEDELYLIVDIDAEQIINRSLGNDISIEHSVQGHQNITSGDRIKASKQLDFNCTITEHDSIDDVGTGEVRLYVPDSFTKSGSVQIRIDEVGGRRYAGAYAIYLVTYSVRPDVNILTFLGLDRMLSRPENKIFLAFVGLSLISIFHKVCKNRRKKKEEEDRRIQEQLELEKIEAEKLIKQKKAEERAELISFYNGHDFSEFYSVPDIFCLKKDVPHFICGNDDELYVYISPRGKSYHTRSCRYSTYTQKCGVWEAIHKGRVPCSVCAPPRYDFSWYYRYKEDQRKLRAEDISITVKDGVIIAEDMRKTS